MECLSSCITIESKQNSHLKDVSHLFLHVSLFFLDFFLVRKKVNDFEHSDFFHLYLGGHFLSKKQVKLNKRVVSLSFFIQFQIYPLLLAHGGEIAHRECHRHYWGAQRDSVVHWELLRSCILESGTFLFRQLHCK